MILARPATSEDSALILAWRNDPIARAGSLSTELVSLEDHERWFGGVLDDPTRHLYIGVDASDRVVGSVRFDARQAGYEVSIMLASKWRGHGLATPLLSAAMERLRTDIGSDGPFSAKIRAENVASLRVFANLGFSEDRRADGVVELSRPPGPLVDPS